MKPVESKDVLRWLGSGNTADSPELLAHIHSAVQKLEAAVQPREIHRFFPLSFDGDTFRIADASFTSRSLSRNLKGCTEIAMMACTLGPEPDRLIRRAQISSMTDAAILQAVCTVMIENWCDEVNETIRAEAAEKHLFLRPRYSPGYGDLALESQRDFFRILDITKHTGISLTEGCLMVPTKSVTAFIGLSETDRNCILSGCEDCNMHDTCMYSRTEKHV